MIPGRDGVAPHHVTRRADPCDLHLDRPSTGGRQVQRHAPPGATDCGQQYPVTVSYPSRQPATRATPASDRHPPAARSATVEHPCGHIGTVVGERRCLTGDTLAEVDVVTIRDLRNRGGEIVDRVARGGSAVITRDGTPVAELHAIRSEPMRAETLVERWRRVPRVDPDRLRRDIDAALDMTL